jgi:hypothetical protein
MLRLDSWILWVMSNWHGVLPASLDAHHLVLQVTFLCTKR